MKRSLFLAGFLAFTPAVALAQDNGTTGSITPGVTDDDTRTSAPVPGDNSFTEPQVRARLAEAGYTGIGSLSLDSDGVWRTTAIKGDTLVSLGLDNRGTIVEK